MLALGLGQVAEQLADRGVLAALGGAFVEAPGLQLDHHRIVAHCVEAELLGQPDRARRTKPLDIFAPDQRDVLAEVRAVESMSMRR